MVNYPDSRQRNNLYNLTTNILCKPDDRHRYILSYTKYKMYNNYVNTIKMVLYSVKMSTYFKSI